MVIDTSAVLTILFNEPEAEQFEVALETAAARLMSVASVLEAAIVVEARLGEAGGQECDLLLSTANITIVPVTAAHVAAARQAYRTYGNGRHPVGLNYGDCFAYATANLSGELLLFKGNDFGQADIKPWTSAMQPKA